VLSYFQLRRQDQVHESQASLLTYKNDPNDLIWIDDRAMNSFVHRDGTKLVDTIDTLNALRKFKRLNDDDYFRCLHRYRDSG